MTRRPNATSLPAIALCLCFVTGARAQTIDFETLPNGDPTVDMQVISTEYAATPYGVSFEVVDELGNFIGFPRVAKSGAPATAFKGCPGSDQAYAGQGLGQSFLTDDDVVGFFGNLRVTYTNPVQVASGQLIDVDVHTGTQPEQWTISAFDGSGGLVDQVVITAEFGPDNPCTSCPTTGPGDGGARTWVLQSLSGPEIHSILFDYTGTTIGQTGFAFDNFSPSTNPIVPRWTDLGGGTPGIAGVPTLQGAGSLVGGIPATISLTQAPSSAPMLAWISFAPTPFSAIGGTVHAYPFASQLFVFADGSGQYVASTLWPTGIPAGTEIWFQFIVEDLTTVHGLTLSNGLLATTP